jgi:transcriptional regulator with XRE-family HTH domain
MEQARDTVSRDNGHDDERDGAPPVVAVIRPASASARLRAAREARGLTLADIAARTRITLRHVEALDRGDFAALPGRPYVLGFVRNYARVVGLDEGDLAALARSELDAHAPKAAPRTVHQFDVDDPDKTPSRMLTWLAIGLFVAVLGAGAVFWRSYYAPATDLPTLLPPEPAASATAAPAVHAAAPVAAPAGPVVFTARENGVWVKFYDGHGQQLMQKQMAQGESYTVPADAVDPKLWTGRPDALSITIGGQAVPPLSDHRGIVRDVPVTAQALRARAAPAATPAPAAGAAPAAAAPVSPPPHRRPHPIATGATELAAPSPAASDAAPLPLPAPAAATPSGTTP